MKSFLCFVFALAMVSCARVQTLNLEGHHYSERPNHIVWIQLAGFSEEHIPLLKFNGVEASYQVGLEQVDCVGKMWNYNLYELRPEANKSFISQANGSKNIKGTCADFEKASVWSFLDEIGYKVSILENGASAEQTLEKAISCSENKLINLSKIRYYRMGPDVNSSVTSATNSSHKIFHYQDSPEQAHQSLSPGLYYDRSCQKGSCYSSLSNNFKSQWRLLTKNNEKTFFLVRDFNFQNALKKKDLSLARELLQEIDKISMELKNEKNDDLLVIVSGAESMPIEFPLQGKPWAEFEKSGKNVIYKNSSLMSPVLAKGAMAENFCGIFDEAEMQKRILQKPERKRFNWDYINPF